MLWLRKFRISRSARCVAVTLAHVVAAVAATMASRTCSVRAHMPPVRAGYSLLVRASSKPVLSWNATLTLKCLPTSAGDQGVGAAHRSADLGLDRHVVDPYPLVAVADAGEPVGIGDPRRHGGQRIPDHGGRTGDGGQARGRDVLRGRVDRDSIHGASALP